ncbi:MAG TPA: penicillin-binding protein 2 [Gammaproteobacteria bacterium]|nr:penicillin-binding protein 2 [Gammaproteobacteria bacterium]
MSTRFVLKDTVNESRLLNDRLIAVTVIALVLFTILFIRLSVLQVLKHDHFNLLSDKNRVDIKAVPPQRGLIYDRNGVILAENTPTFSLELTPEQVIEMDETLLQLAKLFQLTSDEISVIKKQIQQQSRFRKIVIRQRLTEQEVAIFSANRHRLAGVDVASRLIRHYPHKNLFSHVLGYVGRINEAEQAMIDEQVYKGTLQIGKTGVERYYETLLHGQVGHQRIETNVQGRTVRELAFQPSISGQSLHLYLDIDLQKTAAEALAEHKGSIIALDPNTGGVLAMVSKPDFDPNLFVSGISRQDYARLRDSEDRPLFDRSTRGRYPPGSTLKPFVALAGLEANSISENKTTYCPGWYSLPGQDHRYRCWKEHGHGHMNMKQSIAQSCDVYYYDLANDLGIDPMHDFLHQFGFGLRTGVDLPNEASGLSPSSQWKREARGQVWYPGETLISGIGQGFNQTTPLQLAYATSLLAKKGRGFKPQIVQGVKEAEQEEWSLLATKESGPIDIDNTTNWNKVIQAMVEVTAGEGGTARKVAVGLPFEVAGKTGTAQVFGIKQDEKYNVEELDKRLHDHALFITFAPADKPEIVVAVVVENGGSGSKAAAPMAKKMLDKYFSQL